MTEHDTTSFLAEHPRLIGVLFALLVFLVQSEPALGAGAVIHPGP